MNKDRLLDLLVCPNCSSKLHSFSKCDACRAVFAERDGIPAIFPDQSAKKTVTFTFEACRSTRSSDFEKCFKYPARCGAAGPDKPFRCDQSFVAIIERLPSPLIVLEIGCGGAQMRQYVQSLGHEYIGVDISKSRVDETLQAHGGPDLLCDAHFLPFAAQRVDIVYSVALTEHVASPFLLAQEVARCLKPGGYYFGNCSLLEPWHDDSFFHLTPLGTYEVLIQAGFNIQNIWPGKGYSGYRAVLTMGNKVTRPLAFLGSAMHFLYASGNRLRNLAKGRAWKEESIADAARVSGAIDWIARRPLRQA